MKHCLFIMAFCIAIPRSSGAFTGSECSVPQLVGDGSCQGSATLKIECGWDCLDCCALAGSAEPATCVLHPGCDGYVDPSPPATTTTTTTTTTTAAPPAPYDPLQELINYLYHYQDQIIKASALAPAFIALSTNFVASFANSKAGRRMDNFMRKNLDTIKQQMIKGMQRLHKAVRRHKY